MIVYLAASLVCALLAVLFFAGKGGALVRGTAGAETAEEFFDEKKLRIVSGFGMTALSAALAACAFFFRAIPFWLPMAVSAFICAILVLLCNTVCALPQPQPWYRRTAGMAFLGLCVLLVFAFSAFGKSGEITITPGAGSFTVRGSFGSTETIEYARVQSVELVHGWESGTRLRGVQNNRTLEGTFRNDENGEYLQYAYTACDARVLVRTDNKTFALGAPTAQQTKALYALLSERTAQNAAQRND